MEESVVCHDDIRASWRIVESDLLANLERTRCDEFKGMFLWIISTRETRRSKVDEISQRCQKGVLGWSHERYCVIVHRHDLVVRCFLGHSTFFILCLLYPIVRWHVCWRHIRILILGRFCFSNRLVLRFVYCHCIIVIVQVPYRKIMATRNHHCKRPSKVIVRIHPLFAILIIICRVSIGRTKHLRTFPRQRSHHSVIHFIHILSYATCQITNFHSNLVCSPLQILLAPQKRKGVSGS
mmetsp:Transcript_1209/g.2819  ORF Transcript_1209/g.2819 Transcript_1209/m.2819 type:complete len:238 (-) Transcript_1209:1300-2013(-)